MLNAITVDVEDYFQVAAFSEVVCPDDWPTFECRVVQNTDQILGILKEYNTKATFFFLGWVAERYPCLVRRVHAEGHEIATHGYAHQLVSKQTPQEFRRDIEHSVHLLEDIIGEKIRGYRAPSYSITPKTAWALDVLQDLGLRYDSSLFPIHHDLGGFPGTPRYPYQIHEGFWEFPLTTWRFWRWNAPIAGGGYLRLYPYCFTRWAVKKINDKGLPAVIYIHPWELDPSQPRIEGSSLPSRFRHYQNLDKTAKKFRSLCRDFELAPIGEVLQGWKSQHRIVLEGGNEKRSMVVEALSRG